MLDFRNPGRILRCPPVSVLASPVLLLAVTLTTNAAPPAVEALFPSGGQKGTTVLVEAVGKLTDWPPNVWCPAPGMQWEATEEKGKFHVRIDATVSPGPYPVRFYNGDGPGKLIPFVVSSFPEVLEPADNDIASESLPAQALPLVINGRLERTNDIDFFRLALRGDQHLEARLHCYGLGSPADPFLHLLNPSGLEVASASVSHNLDPVLRHGIRESGPHTLQVAAIDHKASTDVSFTGSNRTVYRLILTESGNPPPAGQGWPPPTEQESSRENETPMKLTAPVRLAGSLSQPRETDLYTFDCAKGDRLEIRVESFEYETLLDAVLKVIRPDGRDYKVVDDASKTTRDPSLLFTAPLEGTYRLEIWDRFRRGGAAFPYHLVVEPPRPGFSATAKTDSLALEPGEETSLSCRLERSHGHSDPLKLRIEGLPKGVSLVEEAELPSKTGDFSLKLITSQDAIPGCHPVRITLSESRSENSLSKPITFSFQTSESRGPYLLDDTDQIWLTVKPAEEEKKSS